MVDLLIVAFRYLHILFAIAWIGALLYGVAVLRVALGRADLEARKGTMRHLIPVATHYVPMSAVMTILFGVLLYLFMGAFSLAILLGTTWGLVLFVALLVTLVAFGYGMLVPMQAAKAIQPHLEEAVCEHEEAVGRLQGRFNGGQVVVLVLGLLILAMMVVASAAL